MGFQHHRKLMTDTLILNLCKPICNITDYCEPACLIHCPTKCSCTSICYSTPSPPWYQDSHPPEKSNRGPRLLIISLAVLSAVFLVVCFGAMYYRFSGSRRRQQQRQQRNGTGDDFLDEDQGPMLDHPIWYIRTTGLQPCQISSITVMNYKKGEGLIDGTDCSVCLSEFQEDETLRLLPKCGHAFHVPCIDTWLRSHTNCPLCRAPIVSSSSSGSSSSNVATATVTPTLPADTLNESHVGNSEANGREILEDGTPELRVFAEEEESETPVQSGRRKTCESSNGSMDVHPRRSISLDSLAAAKIKVDGMRELNEPSVAISQRVAGKVKGSSSVSKTPPEPERSVSMKRSFSYSGILPLSRHSCRGQKTKAPIRSF